jgi:hypothetical protein
MPALRNTQPGGGGEAQLTDALREVIVHGGRVLAVPLPAGRRRHVRFAQELPRRVPRVRAQGSRFGGSHRARAQLLDG